MHDVEPIAAIALSIHPNRFRLQVVTYLLALSLFITPHTLRAETRAPELNPQSLEPGPEGHVSARLQGPENPGPPFKIKELATTEALGYFVPVRTYAQQRGAEPPRYVRQLNTTWLKDIEAANRVDWIDLGLESRLRYEYRDNDFRRKNSALDEPLLLRTRLYAAVKNQLDPFRFTVELQDSRIFNSLYAPNIRDVNKTEVIQGYGELYLKDGLGEDALGHSRPISVKAGRMAFELNNGRLVTRNEWRNTTNTFQGLRTTLGQQTNDWQANLFAMQPIVRLTNQVDVVSQAQWFYGATGEWRQWSKVITLQPYYYLLKQNGSLVTNTSDGTLAAAIAPINRTIHTGGVRGYGVVGDTGLDYDTSYTRQWGDDGGLPHDAYAYNAEVGYTAGYAWKPRLSSSIGFASGDKNPNDHQSQRFERLFDYARPWSNNDYIQMENIRASKIHCELSPTKALQIELNYSWYELASATDRWNGGAGLRDATGKSGKNIGEEIDFRVQYHINKYIGLRVGYAYFMAGDFTKKTSQLVEPGRKDNSSFLYFETTLSAF